MADSLADGVVVKDDPADISRADVPRVLRLGPLLRQGCTDMNPAVIRCLEKECCFYNEEKEP